MLQMRTRLGVGLSAAALAIGMIVGQVPAVSAQDITRGGTLNFGLAGTIRPFDVVEGNVLASRGATVLQAIAETLVFWNPDEGKAEPMLATEWSHSDDLLTWTFKLRQGVKFHDGTDFTSEDVAHHFNRMLDPANKARSRASFEPIKEVVAIDDYTVEFHLRHPWMPLLSQLGTRSMGGPIPSSEWVDAGKQNRHPVGTGPYKFVEWRAHDRLVVDRFDGYWDSENKGFLDKIVFRVLLDNQSRFAALQSGEMDVIWTDRGQTINDATGDPRFDVHVSEGAGGSTMITNAARAPLNDDRLRRAAMLAYNQAAMIKVSWQGTRPFITHPLGKAKDCGDAGYLHFDVAKAKALVDEYKKEKGVDTVKIVMVNTATPRGRELGEIYQQTAKAAGFEVDLQPFDTISKQVYAGEFDIAGWVMRDDADVGPTLFGYVHSQSPGNLSGINDPAIDAVAEKMQKSTSMEDRLNLQCEIVKYMNENGFMSYRGGGRYWVVAKKKVHDIPGPYRGAADVTRTWIEQ